MTDAPNVPAIGTETNTDMPRKTFFKEINAHHVSRECKEKRHSDCDGWYYPEEWNQPQPSCSCSCHLTKTQRERAKVGKELDRRK
jgi:hypothetical protein